jgi:hypothetical protein
LKPVRGVDDLRPQVAGLPGVEIFLPGRLSLSVGVHFHWTLRGSSIACLGFLKWPF